MAAHRYWQVNMTAADGGAEFRLSQIQFRTAAGGADVTQGSGGTASASSTSFGAPGNLFDTDPTNGWGRSVSSGRSVTFDFGSGNAKDIVEFAIGAWSDPTMAPKDFTLRHSDDGVTFTTAATYTGITGWWAGQRRTFNLAGETSTPVAAAAAQYWRLLLITASVPASGLGIAAAELQLRVSAGGADQTSPGGTVANTTNTTGNDGANLFDNNASTYFGINSTNTPGWAMYDLGVGNGKAVMEMGLTASTDANTYPAAFMLQRADEPHSWFTNMSFSGVVWTSGETKYFQSTGEVSGAPSASQRPVVFFMT